MEVDDSIAVPDAADIVDEDIVDDAPDAISKELEFNVDENPNEKTAAAASMEGLRPSTLHLIGVDDLSTDDIREYVTALVNDNFKIEWVDDSSCNLVFDTDEESLVALSQLQLVPAGPTSETEAKLFSRKPLSKLRIRAARMSDVKVRGARERSRWYLFHPPESEMQETHYRNRSRRDRERSPPRGYGRARGRTHSPQREDLFPDKISGTQSPPQGSSYRQRRRSRSPLRSPQHDLFPEKLAGQARSSSRETSREHSFTTSTDSPEHLRSRSERRDRMIGLEASSGNRLLTELEGQNKKPRSLAERLEPSVKKRAHQF